MSAPENPAAFPRDGVLPQFGMSLRDWFAGQALAGVLSAGRTYPAGTSEAAIIDSVIEAAFQFADAMLTERAKGGQQ